MIPQFVTGMTYIEGTPFVWGIPCTKRPLSDFLKSCGFVEWVCPHCTGHMTGTPGEEICLNACHFTSPQARKLQAGIVAACHAVANR
jgi:hypothetical protein